MSERQCADDDAPHNQTQHKFIPLTWNNRKEQLNHKVRAQHASRDSRYIFHVWVFLNVISSREKEISDYRG